ncbi:MAG: hypothetical protein MI974_02100 [Chitinophagales bacterium]|nr:hypothetical protein [Chitinophagales bacterium]
MIAQVSNVANAGLGDLMNLVPTPGKLTIIPVKKFSPVPIPTGVPPYDAMFNPEHWQISDGVSYNKESARGRNEDNPKFDGGTGRSLSFDLTVDGTGASGDQREVLADIVRLKLTVGFNGDLHKPNGLIIIWGTQIFSGVFVSISVKYTLFRSNGTPLRAVVSLSFIEAKDPVFGLKELNLASSDLTHKRIVKDHDRLDLMCFQTYDNSRFYIEVAAANNLTSFRKLRTGQELVFPPTAK